MCTPFDGTGERLDEGRYTAHIDELIEAGLHGLVLCSGTGEYPYLRDEERARLIELGARHVAGRVPTIAQTTALGTTDCIDKAKRAEAAAALATRRIELATSVAIAFARSPMVVANAARDLHASSGGRFVLGLGTQVKGHNERHFSVPWSAPAPRLREYVEALRAISRSWERDELTEPGSSVCCVTCARPEFSLERLSWRVEGERVVYRLPKPRPDGRQHLELGVDELEAPETYGPISPSSPTRTPDRFDGFVGYEVTRGAAAPHPVRGHGRMTCPPL